MGTFDDPDTNETSTFFATNVTKAKVFDLGLTESEECSDEARKNAMIVKVSEERRIVTNTPGANGWHMQRVTQIEDDKTPALNDLITGADSNYTLVAFFYDLQEDLVECAPLKKLDEDTAAMYNALLKEVAAAEAAAENTDAAAGADGVDASNRRDDGKSGKSDVEEFSEDTEFAGETKATKAPRSARSGKATKSRRGISMSISRSGKGSKMAVVFASE